MLKSNGLSFSEYHSELATSLSKIFDDYSLSQSAVNNDWKKHYSSSVIKEQIGSPDIEQAQR